MGYSIAQKGFLCYDAISHSLCISRNMIFFKHKYYFSSIFSLLIVSFLALMISLHQLNVLNSVLSISDDSLHYHKSFSTLIQCLLRLFFEEPSVSIILLIGMVYVPLQLILQFLPLILKQVNMYVWLKLCKNFRLFRRIILGILFPILSILY